MANGLFSSSHMKISRFRLSFAPVLLGVFLSVTAIAAVPSSMQPSPARLNATWLNSPPAHGEDPWLLQGDNLSHWDHRDAFIGNGLIGTRIGEWGDASDFRPGSASFMNGLWGAAGGNPATVEGILELPHWANLRFTDGQRNLRRQIHKQVSDHRQSLDLRTATVTTRYRIEGAGGDLDIEIVVWLARDDPHIGVMQARVRTKRTTRVYLDEFLDALHWPDLQDANSRLDGGDLTLACTSSLHGNRLAISSRLRIKGVEEDTAFSQIACSGAVARRHLALKTSAEGSEFTVTKVVALVSSRQSSDPLATARRELDRACADLPGLRARHEAAWATLWRGRIESDHLRLQTVANASLYRLYCSQRAGLADSVGATGLSNSAWDGVIFWDADFWAVPVYSLFNPGMARSCVAYRHHTLPAARALARAAGERGARFAWESAQDGEERCPVPIFREQRHVISSVARAQWLYALAAGDTAWRHGPGLEVIEASAEYWASRARRDDRGAWHIDRVVGPDENAGLVDDNAATNASAAWTLRLAERLLRETGRTPPPLWAEVAKGLVIPWDTTRDIPLQMAGWQDDIRIKQADAVLLAYPWNHPRMDAATTERTVDYYRDRYVVNPIMMGTSMDGILDARLGRADRAWEAFGQLMPYIRKPFFTATQSVNDECLEFNTGQSGLLQLICMGFAGLHGNEDDGPLTLKPCLPLPVQRLELHGVWHQGKMHRLTVSRDQTTGTVSSTVELEPGTTSITTTASPTK